MLVFDPIDPQMTKGLEVRAPAEPVGGIAATMCQRIDGSFSYGHTEGICRSRSKIV